MIMYEHDFVSSSLGSHVKEEADRLADRYSGVDASYLNVQQNPDALAEMVAESDVVVSLLPYSLHGKVAKHCIEGKTHLVTASYVTDEVQALHSE